MNLRKENQTLKDEVRRLTEMLQNERVARKDAVPAESVQSQVERTAAEMRKSGAKEEDVQAFLTQYNMAA